jgi:hypothetical protein
MLDEEILHWVKKESGDVDHEKEWLFLVTIMMFTSLLIVSEVKAD